MASVSILLQVILTSMLTVFTEMMSNQKLQAKIFLKHLDLAMGSVQDTALILITQ
jgi:hypothetical protein